MTHADLKVSVDTLIVKLENFKVLATCTDNKAKQAKARLLSVEIAKELKEFRTISVAVGKIPER